MQRELNKILRFLRVFYIYCKFTNFVYTVTINFIFNLLIVNNEYDTYLFINLYFNLIP